MFKQWLSQADFFVRDLRRRAREHPGKSAVAGNRGVPWLLEFRASFDLFFSDRF